MKIKVDFSDWLIHKINIQIVNQKYLTDWTYQLIDDITNELVDTQSHLFGNCKVLNENKIQPANRYRLEIDYWEVEKQKKNTVTFVTPTNISSNTIKWITGRALPEDEQYYQDSPSLILTREFELTEKPYLGVISIVGLGYYEVKINGKKVTSHKLINDWSAVDKRIYYQTYDITNYLQPFNVVEVELGNGWYNPAPLKLFGKYSLQDALTTGNPCTKGVITIKDSSGSRNINTDTEWQATIGKTLFNNIYLGEKYDFRFTEPVLGFATEVKGPRGQLLPSFIPQQDVLSVHHPVKIKQLGNNKLLVDFGHIYEGFIKTSIRGHSNQNINYIYGESLDSSGNVDTFSTRAGQIGPINEFELRGGSGLTPFPAIQKDQLILTDGLCNFENKFSYHSFRYVVIYGLKKEQLMSIQAETVATKQDKVGRIKTNDSYLNELMKAGIETKINNTHSIFEDCAREHFGYLGDIAELLKSQLYVFDSQSLLKKTIIDAVDTQASDGSIAETAPYVGINSNGAGMGGPLAWQLMMPYSVQEYIHFYGKQSWLNQVSQTLIKHANYLIKLSTKNVSNMCLGDWGSADSIMQNGRAVAAPAQDFTAHCTLLLTLQIYCSLAKTFSWSKSELHNLERTCANINSVIKMKYTNENGSFSDGSQTSYTYALLLNLSEQPQKTFLLLVENIKKHGGQIRTGVFGTPLLYRILSEMGRADIVWEWLHKKGVNTFSEMLVTGNGTLQEQLFLAPASLNHAMFASYLEWCYEYILGIKIIGYQNNRDRFEIKITEKLLDLLDVNGEYQTNNGLIKIKWQIKDGNRTEVIEIPNHTDLVFKNVKNYVCVKSDEGVQLESDGGIIYIKSTLAIKCNVTKKKSQIIISSY